MYADKNLRANANQMLTTHGSNLIAVHCNGTLFDGDGYPSARTCAVMQRLVDSGHQIVATSRRSGRTTCSDVVQY